MIVAVVPLIRYSPAFRTRDNPKHFGGSRVRNSGPTIFRRSGHAILQNILEDRVSGTPDERLYSHAWDEIQKRMVHVRRLMHGTTHDFLYLISHFGTPPAPPFPAPEGLHPSIQIMICSDNHTRITINNMILTTATIARPSLTTTVQQQQFVNNFKF